MRCLHQDIHIFDFYPQTERIAAFTCPESGYSIMYHNLKNPPMGDKLKWLLKKGVGVFLRVCDSDEKICPPHMLLV